MNGYYRLIPVFQKLHDIMRGKTGAGMNAGEKPPAGDARENEGEYAND
jgi:hypothetical protein